MSSRRMRLLPWAALHSDSEHYHQLVSSIMLNLLRYLDSHSENLPYNQNQFLCCALFAKMFTFVVYCTPNIRCKIRIHFFVELEHNKNLFPNGLGPVVQNYSPVFWINYLLKVLGISQCPLHTCS
jgi:hypothetical protein